MSTFNQGGVVTVIDLEREIEAQCRIYRPCPVRPVRLNLPQPEHDRREALAKQRAREMCRAYGGNPDRTTRDYRDDLPEYLEFFADALEEVDAEMIAASRSMAA